jgi:hypothetical protein
MSLLILGAHISFKRVCCFRRQYRFAALDARGQFSKNYRVVSYGKLACKPCPEYIIIFKVNDNPVR